MPFHLRPRPILQPCFLSPITINASITTHPNLSSGYAKLMQEINPAAALFYRCLGLWSASSFRSDDELTIEIHGCTRLPCSFSLTSSAAALWIISTQAMSARVSGRLRSLRGSAGSSTVEPVSLHASLRETLASFNLPASTTIRQLYDLLSELDHECLRHATDIALDPAHDSTSEVESVAKLAIFLSGSLSQCGYPGTSMFQEIQLRALISSLALLQHNGVHTLDPVLWEQLKLKNISARFQNIAFHVQPHSTLADRIRHAPSIYLVQLASQYVSFINRGDSPWTSVFGPTADIIFSALSLVGAVPLLEQLTTNLEL